MQRRDFLLLAASLDGSVSLKDWVAQDGKPQKWTMTDGILSNGPVGKVNNIVSKKLFGDVEVNVEFRIPKGSNSGIYLQGLYEVQIFDSFGKAKINATDGGSIYHRWIDAKPVGGSTAKVNASKAPGEWQSYLIHFRTPRFENGKKVANAKFLKVLFNRELVQENVECDGPTRSAMNLPESDKGPLMIQGDHGPVEFRKIVVKKLKA